MWGRDREGGGHEALSAKLVPCRDSRTTAGCICCVSDTKHMQCEFYPPPCPSPTWGEGTLWHCTAQSEAAPRNRVSGISRGGYHAHQSSVRHQHCDRCPRRIPIRQAAPC